MGKTVESYRMTIEGEISRWNGFVRALRKDDWEAFEEIMYMCRGYRFEGTWLDGHPVVLVLVKKLEVS